MTRFVALLLALLLPLQFTWGAAAAYCQHEGGSQKVEHLGHHAHEHQADEAAKKPANAKLGIDNDCTACHASCAAMAPTVAPCIDGLLLSYRPALTTPDAHASAPARAPDRPQWPRLA